MNSILQYIESHFGYLRYRTNWHKQSLISKLCCLIGRHDYEFDGCTHAPDGIHGELYCFYCLTRKRGFVSRLDEHRLDTTEPNWDNEGGSQFVHFLDYEDLTPVLANPINVVGHLTKEERLDLFKRAAEVEDKGLVEGLSYDEVNDDESN